MELTFSGHITAADSGRRELIGQIVPFGKPGNTSVGTVIFDVGSIVNLEASGIKLLREHDRTAPVGKAVEFSVNPAGIVGRFKVANTSVGNDILVEAAEGLREGFSVGAKVLDYKYKGEVMHVTAAEIYEVSVVTHPAFGLAEASITEVAASESPEVETLEEKETPVTEQVTPEVEVEAAEAPVVVAAAPVNTPIFTAPRFAPMDSAQYVEASIKAAMGDRDAAIQIQAADDSTSNNTGLTLPTSLGGFLTSTFATRPTIDAVGGASALPAAGMSFTIPKLGTAPTVADANEGAAPSETGMTSDYITVNVNKFSGINRVSFELLERSAPDFGTLLLREMQKAYAKATDNAVIAALTADGTAATAQAGTIAGLQAFMAKEGPAAYVATGGDYATELVASGAWWSELLSANDDSKRPLFSALVPSNAAGSASISQANGNVFGANFRVDHNIATAGLIDESAFLIAPDAVQVWETPQTQLRVNVLTTGEVEIGLHGYLAVSVLKAGGVRRFNLT
jgi:HK97 family phage prohead protease